MAKKISQREFLAIELEKHKRKVAAQEKDIQSKRSTIDVLSAQIKSANLFIAALAAQIAGGTVPTEGEVVIPKSELTAALKTQKVDWYEDKENDSIVIVLQVVEEEGVSDDLSTNDTREAGTQGDNDINVSKEGNEQELPS